ncbi:hypothetical protein ACNOYE_38985 [Nannocystaceae bacterium ST9]
MLGAGAGLGLGHADSFLALTLLAFFLLAAHSLFFFATHTLGFFTTLALGFFDAPTLCVLLAALVFHDLLDSLSLQVLELVECDQG